MRIAACLLMLVAGCVQVAVPQSDAESGSSNRSSLSPGIYFGTVACVIVTTLNGETVSETVEGDGTLVIGESGIPERNGEEEYVGRTNRDVLLGIEFTSTVTDVSAFSNGLQTQSSGRASSDCCEVFLRTRVVYRPLSNGRIEVTATTSRSVISNSQSFEETEACRGIVSQ